MRISALELQNTAPALTREWIILGMETQWNSGQHSRQLDRWQPGYSLGLANTFATFVKAWVSQMFLSNRAPPLPLLSVCTNQAAGLPVSLLSDWRQSGTRGEPRAAPNCQTQVKHNLHTVTTKYWTNFYGFNTLMLFLWVLNYHL